MLPEPGVSLTWRCVLYNDMCILWSKRCLFVLARFARDRMSATLVNGAGQQGFYAGEECRESAVGGTGVSFRAQSGNVPAAGTRDPRRY